MSDSWMVRPDYAELAKTYNAVGAAISTVFLFTRLWARTTQYKGLWWDDYFLITAWTLQLIGNGLSAAAPAYGFNVYSAMTAPRGWAFTYGSLSLWLLAAAFVKTAFTATLLRLSSGRIKIILWLMVPLVWGFAIPAAIVAWLDICEAAVSVSIKTACVSRTTYLWIFIGTSVSAVAVDLLLAYLPWRIITQVHLPKREKWAVSLSMSMTVLSCIVCVVKMTQMGNLAELDKQNLDYTFGAVATHALATLEIVLHFVAQTVPLLRVLIVGSKASSRTGVRSASLAEISRATGDTQEKSKAAPDLDRLAGDHESIELVELPGGRIVAADSEEAQAHRTAQPHRESTGAVPQQAGEDGNQGATSQHVQEDADDDGVTIDDRIHKLWADMGLSRRAWSKSPSPLQAAVRRRRQPSHVSL